MILRIFLFACIVPLQVKWVILVSLEIEEVLVLMASKELKGLRVNLENKGHQVLDSTHNESLCLKL